MEKITLNSSNCKEYTTEQIKEKIKTVRKFADLEIGDSVKWHGYNWQFTEYVVTATNVKHTENVFFDGSKKRTFKGVELTEVRTHTGILPNPRKRYYPNSMKFDSEFLTIVKI